MLSRSFVRAPSTIRQLKTVPITYATKNDPSSPKELVSGAPTELVATRTVRIFKESKPATQSGHHNGKYWKLDWDVLGKGNRWENDLMGYQGSADPLQGTVMKFDSAECAIKFAESQGWDYSVQKPNVRHFRKKEYANNFLHSPSKLKHIRTK